jgi:CDP-diacylglycerol--serine O-phosphatidyltransferase
MLTAFYTLLIAFLMVSRLPVFSGKTVRMRVPPEMVLPVFVSVVFFIALLIGYPWHILSAGTVLYLLSLPLGWKSYRDHQRHADAQAVTPADIAPANPAPPPTSTPTPASPVSDPDHDDRPTRLN